MVTPSPPLFNSSRDVVGDPVEMVVLTVEPMLTEIAPTVGVESTVMVRLAVLLLGKFATAPTASGMVCGVQLVASFQVPPPPVPDGPVQSVARTADTAKK